MNNTEQGFRPLFCGHLVFQNNLQYSYSAFENFDISVCFSFFPNRTTVVDLPFKTGQQYFPVWLWDLQRWTFL